MACGCVGIHPGQTHEEHMDAFDRATNEGQIKTGHERLRLARNYGEAVSARALIRHGIDAEIRRLKEKEMRLLAAQQ